MNETTASPKPLDGHIELKSSLLKSCAYDPASQTCEIVFKSGGRYQYQNFSPEKWEEFRTAESSGKFFLGQIKGKFEFSKVEEPKEGE